MQVFLIFKHSFIGHLLNSGNREGGRQGFPDHLVWLCHCTCVTRLEPESFGPGHLRRKIGPLVHPSGSLALAVQPLLEAIEDSWARN